MLMYDRMFIFFLMIRRPPRSTQSRSSAASDVYKRQEHSWQMFQPMPWVQTGVDGCEYASNGWIRSYKINKVNDRLRQIRVYTSGGVFSLCKLVRYRIMFQCRDGGFFIQASFTSEVESCFRKMVSIKFLNVSVKLQNCLLYTSPSPRDS
eukprot:TRINITY_DN8539_c0_g1_i1.p1 TRINITY_DN8539_c0_g1~~TRINITY_DN8539_c0_g1_i1.p1  ORF type:complete len:150 (+),score=44.79 TRINITY_DN8539_c0_g1_i1:12-461(+)